MYSRNRSSSLRLERYSAIASLVLTLVACVDSPTSAVDSDNFQAVALTNRTGENHPNYCAELAALAPKTSQGSLSCVNGSFTINGREVRVPAAEAAKLARYIERGLDLAADKRVLEEYQQYGGGTLTLRTRSGELNLARAVLLDDPRTKAQFCAAQKTLFNEAKNAYDVAFATYWGSIATVTVGIAGGAAGAGAASVAAAIAAAYILDNQADDLQDTMERNFVTMAATSENYVAAGC
jgi:hypothetical protein